MKGMRLGFCFRRVAWGQESIDVFSSYLNIILTSSDDNDDDDDTDNNDYCRSNIL